MLGVVILKFGDSFACANRDVVPFPVLISVVAACGRLIGVIICLRRDCVTGNFRRSDQSAKLS